MSQEQKDRVELQQSVDSVNPVTPPPDSTSSETQAVQSEETAVLEEPGQGQESVLSEEQSERPRTKKRVRRRTKLVNVEEILPHPSLWPLALAVSVAIAMFGILAGPIVCGIGVLLIIVSIVFWSVERR